MKTFIKVTEIWVPNKERTQLELNSGVYGQDYKEFMLISENKKFAYQQGLPGHVWATGQPIVITDLEHSYFERTEAAYQSGLTCAIGLPVMSGEFLLAVVVFLCGDDEDHAGAIEIWANQSHRDSLRLVDGYYGTLQEFETVSRTTTLGKGIGLPGLVWEKEEPVIIEDLGDSRHFIRSEHAKRADISMGIGIPVAMQGDRVYIMTFLSARATPIAKRMQIWLPDREHKRLYCQIGFGKNNNELASLFEHKGIAKGEGLIGQVWLTGLPIIGKSTANSDLSDPSAISSLLAIPVIEYGSLKAVVTFLF